MGKRDLNILSRISECCDQINAAMVFFGADLQTFEKNRIYQDACAMNVLQIGEMAGRLSAEFREKCRDVPWQDIKGMRNVFAHEYEYVDLQVLWQTMTEDIPKLKKFCVKLLEEQI